MILILTDERHDGHAAWVVTKLRDRGADPVVFDYGLFPSQSQISFSYAAKGGVLQPKPTCSAGSENFSAFAEFSQPTTFAGGTIDTAYGPSGGVYIRGSLITGAFPDGTHVLYPGSGATPFRLTFTTAVNSVTLDAEPITVDLETITVTAYDASNTILGGNTVTLQQTSGPQKATLSVSSTSNNIKYFTIDTSDRLGVIFTNIVWGCAA